MRIVKKIVHSGKISQAIILPKIWLDNYPGIEEVFMDLEDTTILLTPIYGCVRKKEGVKP